MFSRDLIWRLAESVSVLLSLLVTQLALTRNLGPDGYGTLAYLLALLAFVAQCAKLGAGGVVTGAIVANPSRSREILETALLWRLLGGVAATAIALGVFYFDSIAANHFAFLGVATSQALSIYAVLESRYDASRRGFAYLPSRALIVLLFALTKATAAYLGCGVNGLLLVYAAEPIVIAVVQLRTYTIDYGRMPVPRFRGDFLVWFKARAFYVFLAGLAETVYLRADMLILARFSTLAEVGHYSLAARLCEAVYFVPAILMASFYAKVWDPINPMGITRCRERRMVTVVAALGVLAAVGLSIVAVVIVPSAFGAGYLESIPLMLLYAWSTPFVFIRVFLSRWLIAADILRYSFLATAASAIISIAIYLILIPRYGAVGAAIGTVVAYSVAGVGVFFVFKKTRPIAVTIILELLTVFKITKYRPYYRWMRRRFFLARGA